MYNGGGDAVQDPLKMKYGVKTPYGMKEEQIKQLYDNNKRYYPSDIRGNVDEWGAVLKHRTEVYQREQAEAQIQKQLHKKDYANELEQAIAQKKYAGEMEKMNKD